MLLSVPIKMQRLISMKNSKKEMNNLVARYKKILKNELIKAPLDTIKKIKQSLPPQSTAEMDEFLIHESNWTDLQERQRKGVISDQQYNLLRSHLFSRILLSITTATNALSGLQPTEPTARRNSSIETATSARPELQSDKPTA